jgi:hypothetical protein
MGRKYVRDNSAFRKYIAAKAAARRRSTPGRLAVAGYWILANCVKLWAWVSGR